MRLLHLCTYICIERERERERERDRKKDRESCRGIFVCIYIHTHTHVRGLTCVHHVVVLQKKNGNLLEYAKKGLTGGILMALKAGADVNHEDEV